MLKFFLASSSKTKTVFLCHSGILKTKAVANNISGSLEKLTGTDSVDFAKSHGRFARFPWFKQHSKFAATKLNFFNVCNNRVFRLMQSLTLVETHFKHFLRIRNQLVAVTEKCIISKKKTCLHCRRQECSRIRINNSRCFIKQLKLLIFQTRIIVLKCWGTIWKNQIIHVSKSERLPERRSRRNFNKTFCKL